MPPARPVINRVGAVAPVTPDVCAPDGGCRAGPMTLNQAQAPPPVARHIGPGTTASLTPVTAVTPGMGRACSGDTAGEILATAEVLDTEGADSGGECPDVAGERILATIVVLDTGGEWPETAASRTPAAVDSGATMTDEVAGLAAHLIHLLEHLVHRPVAPGRQNYLQTVSAVAKVIHIATPSMARS